MDFWQAERDQLGDAAQRVESAGSWLEYFARQLTPLLRALLLAGAAGFGLFAFASSLQGASLAPLTPPLTVVVLALVAIAGAGFARLRPGHLSALGLLCVVMVEAGIVLIGMTHAEGLRWVLPGFVLVPIAASPVWLTQRDFAIGTLVCVLGPVATCWLVHPALLSVIQCGVFVLLSLGLSLVIHFFMVRQLRAQFSMEQRLRVIAGTDNLTGIANRRRFLALAREQLIASRRDRQVLSALYLDVDHFKAVNDGFGHAAGDYALVALTGTLRAHLRAADIIGRIGGEEFAVLLPELDLGQAAATAERLRAAASGMPILGGPITISVGVAELHGRDTAPDMLLGRADDALRQAKRDGRDRVRVASEARGVARVDASNVVRMPSAK